MTDSPRKKIPETLIPISEEPLSERLLEADKLRIKRIDDLAQLLESEGSLINDRQARRRT